jgi:D-alanine-D-alanine ligase
MLNIAVVWVDSENTPWKEAIDEHTVNGIVECLTELDCLVDIIEITEIPTDKIAEELCAYDCILNLSYGIHAWTQADLAFWFDLKKIPQIASSGLAQRIAQDKLSVEYRCLDKGIQVPISLISKDEIEDNLMYISKPRFGGCHRGISIKEGLEIKDNWLEFSGKDLLIQPYYIGREFSIAVIPNIQADGFEALPPLEIVPFPERDVFIAGSSFGETRRNFEPQLAQAKIEQMQAIALAAHKLIGLDYYSRCDFRLVGDEIYLLDVNAMPNLHHKFSMLPALLVQHNIGMKEFVRRLLSLYYLKNKAHQDALDLVF